MLFDEPLSNLDAKLRVQMRIEIRKLQRRLGVTAINLLPVHYFLDEKHLVASGRGNYWGYNTLGFFAPEPSYAARCNGQSVIAEFR